MTYQHIALNFWIRKGNAINNPQFRFVKRTSLVREGLYNKGHSEERKKGLSDPILIILSCLPFPSIYEVFVSFPSRASGERCKKRRSSDRTGGGIKGLEDESGFLLGLLHKKMSARGDGG